MKGLPVFPINKTKIVCTIGPASRSPEVLSQLVSAGMNVARLNFFHGEFSGLARDIEAIRQASAALNRGVGDHGRPAGLQDPHRRTRR